MYSFSSVSVYSWVNATQFFMNNFDITFQKILHTGSLLLVSLFLTLSANEHLPPGGGTSQFDSMGIKKLQSHIMYVREWLEAKIHGP